MLCYDLVEVFEVASLLIVHVFHERAEMGMCSDCGWSLCLVYENSSKLTSLIYSELETVRLIELVMSCMGLAYSRIQEAFLFSSQGTLPLP